ncbi:MAG: RNA-guided endonuclease InsQ/TnpB family protein [Chitinophagales bacterium]
MFGKKQHKTSSKIQAYKSRLKGLSKLQYLFFKKQARISKDLYNQALYTFKETKKHKGEWLSYPQMDRVMKTCQNLEGNINYRLMMGAGVAQQSLIKLFDNIKASVQAKKDYRINPSKYKSVPQFPHYLAKKGYFSLIFTRSTFRLKGDEWCLYHKRKLVLKQAIPKYILGKRIQQIQLIYRYSHFEVVYMYEDNTEYEQVPKNNNYMGIDLGINDLCTCVTNGIIPPFAVNGRGLKSKNQFWNKRKAHLQHRLDLEQNSYEKRAKAEGKKYHKQKWSKRLERLTQKRNRQIEDVLHKTTHLIEQVCLSEQISKVVIGNVQTSMNELSKMGSRFNQKFRQIPLGKFVKKLRYKLERHGIEVIEREESYTSRASFWDGDWMPTYGKISEQEKKKLKFSGVRRGGKYQLKSLFGGREEYIHADVNGGYNILRKEFPDFSASDIPKEMIWYHPKTVVFYGGRLMTRQEKKRVLHP